MAYLLHGSKEAAGKQVGRMFESDPLKGETLLHELCDHLFDQEKPFITSNDFLDWIKVLFGEDIGFDAMCAKVRSYDYSSLCGCVWTAQFIAYRCRTCATSPCMSLCAACFENGNHEGHDYNVFRSEAGGACDCGDSSVMHKSGFCSHHGPNRSVPPFPPVGFLSAGKVLLDRMFLLVIQYLRQTYSSQKLDPNLSPVFKLYLQFLLDIIKLGSPIRSHLKDLLLNESLYSNLKECKGYKCLEDSNSSISTYHKKTIEWFDEAVKETGQPHIMVGIKDFGQFKRAFEYRNYLDEITFWIVKFMFPESLILIVLNLLPDADIKREFSKCFARHYTRIAESLVKSQDLDPLTNRVVHISVQLFSNEELACMLCNEENLLQIFIASMHNVLSLALVHSETNSSDLHYCISAASSVLRSNVYWPIVSDMVNVLGHRDASFMLLREKSLFECWLQELLGFCQMAMNKRALDAHVEFEPDSNQMLVPFYSEREACASPLWCMLAVLTDTTTSGLSYNIIRSVLSSLQDLFDALGLNGASGSLAYDQVSFHHPLHRYLAHFVSNAIKNQGATITEMFIAPSFARLLIAHPLQTLVAIFEVQSAMWVRNGLYMASQSLAHRQYFFSKFFMDADLYMIQLCSCILPPHYVIALLLERCRVLECLQVSGVSLIVGHVYPYSGELGKPHEDKLTKMFEAVFCILQYIFAINCLKGSTDEELIRSELITLLTMKPSTYSALTDHTPQSHESHTGSKNALYMDTLHRVLDVYASKNEGKGMTQTKYVPNNEAWKLYDPVFSQYRSLYQRDLQKAHANYVEHLQSRNELDSSASDTDLWPPYRPINDLPSKYWSLSGLLQSRLFHSLVFIVLQNVTSVSDNTLAIVLHLLDTALRLRSDSDPPSLKQELYDQSWCWPLLQWFSTDDVLPNMVKIVSFRNPTVTDVDEPMMTDAAEDQNKVIYTGECIVSLLLKLHYKWNGKNEPFNVDDCSVSPPSFTPSLPPTRANVISNILSIASYKSKDIKQMIQIVSKTLLPHPSSSDSQISSETSAEAREKRRKKAKEAQNRLMKEFAIKQKEFLKTTELVKPDDNDVTVTDSKPESPESAPSDPGDWGLEAFPIYECVICGSSEVELQVAPGSERLMGLVCLAQPSSVLGHRTTSGQALSPYPPSARPSSQNTDTCRSHLLKRCQTIRTLVDAGKLDDDVFAEQSDFATAVGTHLSTCGHHVHLYCHSNYMDSMISQGRTQLSRDMKKAFRCPLCRQVSNVVLPCNVRRRQRDSSNTDLDRQSLIKETWRESLNDITSVSETDSLGAKIGYSRKNIGLTIPLVALVRYNVEYLIMLENDFSTRSNDDVGPSSLSSLARKYPIGSLYVLMHCLSQIPDSETDLINSEHTARICDRLKGGNEISCTNGDPPLLIQDSVTLLFRLLLDCPLLVADYQSCVLLVYNLVFVQSLVDICFKFSPDERRAWSDFKPSDAKPAELESFMGIIIRCSPDQIFQSTNHVSDGFSTSFLNTVFTPQSVYGGVEKNLLHFMRIASVLQSQIFPHMQMLADDKNENQFHVLAASLGLCRVDSSSTDVMQCLSWSDPESLISAWCAELADTSKFNHENCLTLLGNRRLWPSSPKVLDLPQDYSNLFQMYRMKPCPCCKSIPKEAALCLACGELLCFKTLCDRRRDNVSDDLVFILAAGPMRFTREMHACTRHARRCGAGTCMLLQVHTSAIVVVRGSRTCYWGTLYLDAHGEEDRGWRRGRPLFLRRERLELLEQQWIHHLFDNTAKDWGIHRNLL